MSDLPPPSPNPPDALPEVTPPAMQPPDVPMHETSIPDPAPVPGESGDEPQPKDSNEKTLGMVMNLLQLSGIIFAKIPFVGVIAPLVLWLVKREESPYLDAVGKEVINFQINLGVAVLVGLLMCVFPGIIIGIAGLVLIIIGAIKTNEGKFYRYPWIYRIIK
jgi:hypothetical protein